MATNPSPHDMGMSANAHKRLEARRSGPKTARAEVAKAEAFIAEAAGTAELVESGDVILEETVGELKAELAPKAPRSTRKPVQYTFTAEMLREAREGGKGRSWADVAKMLGLGNPGAARKAWADVIGEPHTQARTLVGRATKGARSSTKLVTPKWDANADGDQVIASLAGAQITVKSSLYGNESTENLNVAFVTEYDESGDEPVVTFVEGVLHKGEKGENLLNEKVSTGATRTIAISRIVEVR